MLKGGIENLISMNFFIGLDFEQLEQRKVEAPFKPPAVDLEKIAQKKKPLDLSNAVEWDGSMSTLTLTDDGQS